jgi:putative transcriptional regulator
VSMHYNTIKSVLEEKEISQKKLSDLMGVSVVTINSWCNQKSQPSIRTLFEISKTLGITPDKLINNKIKE